MARPRPQQPVANLYDPRNGGHSIRVEHLDPGGEPSDLPRTNYFVVCLIRSGSGTAWADATRLAFGPDSLLFFVPYQRVRFEPDGPVRGEIIQFHANFLCVETFHAESGCSGLLFNDPYGLPVVSLDGRTKQDAARLVGLLRREQDERAMAFDEAMLAHLKVLLILAARLKASTGGTCGVGAAGYRHPALVRLAESIEENYHALHSPADYARRLHMTPKTLGRLVREHLGTTLTDLIRNRILTHAKWQLLHTLKPVKEISRETGFDDGLYFSRLFKKATGFSPTFFREFETEIRGGSNLSMSSAQASIPRQAAPADT